MPSVEVALATRNGARFLGPLLHSLFAQTFQGFAVVVADDASDDDTAVILADFQRRYPGRIEVMAFGDHSGGPAANFARLSDRLRGKYVFYCDQDDVWLPDKMARSLECMQASEGRHGAACPILVHTDLTLVDAELCCLHGSFWRSIARNPARIRLRRALVEFCVAGCAMLVNRALYQCARPFPPEAVMHDHWLTLVAAAFGKIEYIDEASILYRQHGSNVGYRRPRNLAGFLERASEYLAETTVRGEREAVEGHIRQAGAFLERYGPALCPDERALVETLAGISKTKRRYRALNLLRKRLLRTSVASNLALFYVLSRLD